MTSIHTPLWIMWSYLPITIKYCVRAVLGLLVNGHSPVRCGFDSKPIRVGFVEDKVLRLSSRNHNSTAPYSFLHRSSTLYTIFAIGSVVERHNNNKKIVFRNAVFKLPLTLLLVSLLAINSGVLSFD